MLLELYSYYLNSKNVYLIYKKATTVGSGACGIGGFNTNGTGITNNNKLNSINNNHY